MHSLVVRAKLCALKLFDRGNRKQNVQISCCRKGEKALFHFKLPFLGFHQVTYGRKVLRVVDGHVMRLTAAVRSFVTNVKVCRHLEILHGFNGHLPA